MGNSEVGHLNLGAGAIVPQDLARIDAAVEDGSLADNEVLHRGLRRRAARPPHRAGSPGGVHSSERHLEALIRAAAKHGVEDLVVHAFTDGRDTSPTSGRRCGRESRGAAPARPASGASAPWSAATSRWTATSRWERTQKALDLLLEGKGEHHADSGEEAVRAAYERDETDEFITTTTVGEEAPIRPGDASSPSTSGPTGCARSRPSSPRSSTATRR